MQSINFEEVVEKIAAQDTRYHVDAYSFLREALAYTQKVVGKSAKGENHVSPKELVGGVRDYALAQFGPMAVTVLDEWGIRATEDIGEIVFNMVEHNLLAKTDTDTREDFKGVFDFSDAFKKPFLPTPKTPSEEKTVI